MSIVQRTYLPGNYLPGNLPIRSPTYQGTYLPGNLATREPTYQGTNLPGNLPTRELTYQGTYLPGNLPTKEPTYQGTYIPGNLPTREHTYQGTYLPGNLPTKEPTYQGTYLSGNLPIREPIASMPLKDWRCTLLHFFRFVYLVSLFWTRLCFEADWVHLSTLSVFYVLMLAWGGYLSLKLSVVMHAGSKLSCFDFLCFCLPMKILRWSYLGRWILITCEDFLQNSWSNYDGIEF